MGLSGHTNGRKRTARAGSTNDTTSAAAAIPPAPDQPATGCLLQGKYRNLIRKHLDALLDKLFAEFTGLHFHISWSPPPPHRWDTLTMPTACSVCCQLSGSPLLKDCRRCGPRQLARALSTDGNGHHFTCRLGVLNYWFRIQVRGETLGIAYLQALDHEPPPRAVQIHDHRRPRASRTSRSTPGQWHAGNDARQMSWMEFARAGRLLQLIVQHVQTASLADLRMADLTVARQAVVALEKQQVRFHAAYPQHYPCAAAARRRAGPESHQEQIVHRLLEFVDENYGQRITLRGYASTLGMNTAYLSDLFSRAVGVPFRTYLTELRLEKAKSLLDDPTKTASDVAYAVGYASENRFRIAFKNATGLSPKLWRETMRTNPLPPPQSS